MDQQAQTIQQAWQVISELLAQKNWTPDDQERSRLALHVINWRPTLQLSRPNSAIQDVSLD